MARHMHRSRAAAACVTILFAACAASGSGPSASERVDSGDAVEGDAGIAGPAPDVRDDTTTPVDAVFVPDVPDVPALAGVQWRELVPDPTPSARSDTGMVTLDNPRRFLLWGGWYGEDQAVGFLGDAWIADAPSDGPVTWVELPLDGGPIDRRSHCTVHDPIASRVIVFAGNSYEPFLGLPDWTSYDKMFNDAWSLYLTPGEEHWEELEPAGERPPTRGSAQCIYDSKRNRLVVFGGMAYGGTAVDGSPDYDDLWALDLTESAERWDRLQPQGQVPPPREGAGAAYDPTTDRMVVMGGTRFDWKVSHDDMWVFDFAQSSWFRVTSTVPPEISRSAQGLYHVPGASDESTFLSFGGLVGQVVQNDIWRIVVHESGSATFERLPIAPPLPAPRGSFGSAIDAAGTLLIFGGTQTGINSLGDTWTLDTNTLWPALARVTR